MAPKQNSGAVMLYIKELNTKPPLFPLEYEMVIFEIRPQA